MPCVSLYARMQSPYFIVAISLLAANINLTLASLACTVALLPTQLRQRVYSTARSDTRVILLLLAAESAAVRCIADD